MKSFTDIEQSEKLAEILPLNSADMTWSKETTITDGTEWYITLGLDRDITDNLFSYRHSYLVPSWSLSALLNYLKSKHRFPEINVMSDGHFKLTTYIWDGTDCTQVSIGDNLVDACYELILKLHELKWL